MSPHRSFLTAACAIGFLVGSPAYAQDQIADDDWDYSEDIEHDTYVASVSYASGQSIMAHCGNNRFMLAITGLPEQEGQPYLATVQIDSTPVAQMWRKMGGVPLLSTEPARDARALRRGGILPLSSSATSHLPAVSAPLELPSQHTNLDKVLTQCGYQLQDDRDHLPDVDTEMKLVGVRTQPTLEHTPTMAIEISCVVTNGQLDDCRPHRTLKGVRPSYLRQEVRRWNGKRVDPQYAQSNEGRVAHINIQMLRVVQEY